jgi:predicted transcriptional regulator of viral defense system
MQRYGLTDRRPEALHLTIPAIDMLKGLMKAKIELDYGPEMKDLPLNEIHRLTIVHHPSTVRKRHIDTFATKNYGQSIRVKGSYARVSTIGQTFLDMLDEPQKCGGMAHVLDIWQEHAKIYLSDIVTAVENAPKPIHKVRAGYILDEVLRVQRPEIQNWVSLAQRGSSRLLDPTKPFTSTFSEKWMISINV